MAIQFNKQILSSLIGLQDALISLGVTGNYTKPENLHLTLALMAYTKRLRRALADEGIPFDKKRFSPHITLIRKYSYRGGKAILVTEAPQGNMMAERISLVESRRGKNGMIYTEIGCI